MFLGSDQTCSRYHAYLVREKKQKHQSEDVFQGPVHCLFYRHLISFLQWQKKKKKKKGRVNVFPAQIKINSGQWSMSFLLGIFIAFVIADCCTYTFHNGATRIDLFGGDHEIFHHKVISGRGGVERVWGWFIFQQI